MPLGTAISAAATRKRSSGVAKGRPKQGSVAADVDNDSRDDDEALAAAAPQRKSGAKRSKAKGLVCGLCNKASTVPGITWGCYVDKKGARVPSGDMCGECKSTFAPFRARMDWTQFKQFAKTSEGLQQIQSCSRGC